MNDFFERDITIYDEDGNKLNKANCVPFVYDSMSFVAVFYTENGKEHYDIKRIEATHFDTAVCTPIEDEFLYVCADKKFW